MIVTDEILNEWSFRCHDGIVDLNDPKKLRILKEILDENGIDLGEAEEGTPEEESNTKIKPTTTMADVEELKKMSKKFKEYSPKMKENTKQKEIHNWNVAVTKTKTS
jgi:division protein CdvB (Snf7/Vps24/ESCRT-III family)